MEHNVMGRVVVEAVIENLQDLWDVKRGLLAADQVRRIVVPNALVDSGTSFLSIPKRLIDELGLTFSYRKRSRAATGTTEVNVHQAAQLTIQGRTCPAEVVELPDDVAVLIGQLPLES